MVTASTEIRVTTASQTQLTALLADRYRIERELGRGGMATVYLAHDLRHDRPVALKVLHPDLASTVGPDRFQREIRLAASKRKISSELTIFEPKHPSFHRDVRVQVTTAYDR